MGSIFIVITTAGPENLKCFLSDPPAYIRIRFQNHLSQFLYSPRKNWHPVVDSGIAKSLFSIAKVSTGSFSFCSSSRHRKAPDLFRLFNQLPATIFFQVLIPYFLYSNVQTINSHMCKLPNCLSWAFIPFQFLVSTQVNFLLALSNW